MNETAKVISYCLSGVVLVLAVFFGTRCIDLIFLHAYSIPGDSIKPSAEAFVNAFQGYRDFVTVITGLLTLFIGATGFAAFFSFRKLREEEKSIVLKMEKDEERIEKLRQRLEERERTDGEKIKDIICDLMRYARIQQARVLLESEADKAAAIDVLEGNESTASSDHIFHQLKGDAYYYRGRHGDYDVAVEEYKKAIQCSESSSASWLGLGQAKYRSVASKNDEQDGDLDIGEVISFRLKENRDTVSDTSVVEEAIRDIKKAISYGASVAEAGIELGHMYKSIEKYDSALDAYQNVLSSNKNHTACAFFYCHLWIVRKYEKLLSEDVSQEEVNEIVRLLKRIGLLDVYNSKVAYALLWYLFSTIKGLGTDKDVDEAYSATTKYTINNLFELVK
jgi:tetratricopeptide (TPR) repeat protein